MLHSARLPVIHKIPRNKKSNPISSKLNRTNTEKKKQIISLNKTKCLLKYRKCFGQKQNSYVINKIPNSDLRIHNSNNPSDINEHKNSSFIMKNESTIAVSPSSIRKNKLKRKVNTSCDSLTKTNNCSQKSLHISKNLSDECIKFLSCIHTTKADHMEENKNKTINATKSFSSRLYEENNQNNCLRDKILNLQMLKKREIKNKSVFNAKKYKMIGEYLVHVLNNDEICDDYIVGNYKPFNRFINFQKQSLNKKVDIKNTIEELNKIRTNNELILKFYIADIRKRKNGLNPALNKSSVC